MSRKPLESYFPKNDKPTFVGGYVPNSLHSKAKPILKKLGFGWSDIIRAALKMLIEEQNKKFVKTASKEKKYVKTQS